MKLKKKLILSIGCFATTAAISVPVITLFTNNNQQITYSSLSLFHSNSKTTSIKNNASPNPADATVQINLDENGRCNLKAIDLGFQKSGQPLKEAMDNFVQKKPLTPDFFYHNLDKFLAGKNNITSPSQIKITGYEVGDGFTNRISICASIAVGAWYDQEGYLTSVKDDYSDLPLPYSIVFTTVPTGINANVDANKLGLSSSTVDDIVQKNIINSNFLMKNEKIIFTGDNNFNVVGREPIVDSVTNVDHDSVKVNVTLKPGAYIIDDLGNESDKNKSLSFTIDNLKYHATEKTDFKSSVNAMQLGLDVNKYTAQEIIDNNIINPNFFIQHAKDFIVGSYDFNDPNKKPEVSVNLHDNKTIKVNVTLKSGSHFTDEFGTVGTTELKGTILITGFQKPKKTSWKINDNQSIDINDIGNDKLGWKGFSNLYASEVHIDTIKKWIQDRKWYMFYEPDGNLSPDNIIVNNLIADAKAGTLTITIDITSGFWKQYCR